MATRLLLPILIFSFARGVLGCDLCAIYNADSASGVGASGLSLAVSEQYIPYDTVQQDGHTLPPSDLDKLYLDKSMTHIVPTWSFAKRFSVSLSLPVIYQSWKEMHLLATSPFVTTTTGQEAGIGDMSLVGRCMVFQVKKNNLGASGSVLAGVKFPTGDTSHLEDEVELTRELDALYGPGHQHAIGGVHLSDLTFGSGSYDGVFGVTVNSRWSRIFCNAQFQYYLRTPGVSGYEFGDEWMISGGPGIYAFLNESFTFSAQVLATYDVMDQDLLLGRPNPNTGLKAVYLGPQLYFTFGERFSANAGVDIPMRLDNNGLQNVPDYRVHLGASFRF